MNPDNKHLYRRNFYRSDVAFILRNPMPLGVGGCQKIDTSTFLIYNINENNYYFFFLVKLQRCSDPNSEMQRPSQDESIIKPLKENTEMERKIKGYS